MAKTIISQVDAGTYYLVTYSDGTEEKLYKSEQKYPPRTTPPASNDKNWIITSYGGYNKCIEANHGSALPNCVGYAWGRWRELLGTDPNLSTGNAETWWDYNDGYKRGQSPKLGAVMVWQHGSSRDPGGADGAGHVAVVEEIKADGTVVWSESGWGWTGGKIFQVSQGNKPNYVNWSGYKFLGFIYLPDNVEYSTSPSNVSGNYDSGEFINLYERYINVYGDKMNDKSCEPGDPSLRGISPEVGGWTEYDLSCPMRRLAFYGDSSQHVNYIALLNNSGIRLTIPESVSVDPNEASSELDETLPWKLYTRPSDIVKAICIFNGWKINEIVDTTKVESSLIEDQVGIGDIQYIKQYLIPISKSEGGLSSYYFYFDDAGLVNYKPMVAEDSNITVRYYANNTTAEIYHNTDEYYYATSVAFAQAGSVLMLGSINNSMQSINMFTGDPLSTEVAQKRENSLTYSDLNDGTDLKINKEIITLDRGTYSEIPEWYKAYYTESQKNYNVFTSNSSYKSPSEIANAMLERYNTISKYNYPGEISIEGCTTIRPGMTINLEVYLSNDGNKLINSGTYSQRNLHHSSGRYWVQEVTDSVSAGKFITTLKVYKLSANTTYSRK